MVLVTHARFDLIENPQVGLIETHGNLHEIRIKVPVWTHKKSIIEELECTNVVEVHCRYCRWLKNLKNTGSISTLSAAIARFGSAARRTSE